MNGDIEKWVLLDACHAGGFWGDSNANDTGDLEKLSNIALFGASGEDGIAYSWPLTNEGMFTSSLIDAFALGTDGYLKADKDQDGDLTFQELDQWISSDWLLQLAQHPATVYERAQGDLIPFSSNMWAPYTAKTDDFVGSLYAGSQEAAPLPNTISLVVSGALSGFLAARRRRKSGHA